MKIINPKDPHSFLQICQDVLEKDEVNASLILGISNTLLENNDEYSKENVYYSIVYNKEISLIGIMTPPKNLLIYEYKDLNNNVIKLFVNELYSKYKTIPGVSGELKLADAFTEEWKKIANCEYRIKNKLRIHKLTRVNEYKKPKGTFRNALNDDLEAITKFILNFHLEINEPIDEKHAIETAKNGIKNNDIFIWENNSVVSMAQKRRPTKNGMAVSLVYTPEKYRGNGYATAVVSELSRNILDSGKHFCTLYTDLSNPVSNSIYKKIGYEPVCDNISYEFIYRME